MCTVTLNINESQLRKVNPSLNSMEAITQWAQHLLDSCIADLTAYREGVAPYTIEELNERIDKSERQFTEGQYSDFDDVMRKIEEEFARADRKEIVETV